MQFNPNSAPIVAATAIGRRPQIRLEAALFGAARAREHA